MPAKTRDKLTAPRRTAMPAKTRDKLTAQLFRAVLSLKDEQQCSNFFEDICTINSNAQTFLKIFVPLPN